MPYSIYPPIGLARLGNSPTDYFIGRESMNSLGVEIASNGSETEVVRFKDSGFRVKRQGARFRIFDVADPSAPVEAQLPQGSVVEWTVELTNRKDAVHRPVSPPASPVAVADDPARTDRVIATTASVSGASANPVPLDGTYRGTPVNLGQIHTDGSQRLVFLGGSGRSETLTVPPAPIGGSFYNNPDWFDDVGDGPVSATIKVPGQPDEEAAGAWVIVAPPDYAPPANGVVTLFDVIRQVAIDEGWMVPPLPPFFESDIRPMVERASSLQYVDDGPVWPMISQDWAALADPADAARNLREETAILVRQVENALHDFELRRWQSDALDAWVDGNFNQGAAPDRGLCDELTRVALDGTLGQGFFPGIEAGVNMMDAARYEAAPFEFRLAHTANRAGDLTALMALPWQADFLKCGQNWWPAQRPDRVPTANGATRPWLRPTMDHRQLVDDVGKLGVMTPDNGTVVEMDRDPQLDQGGAPLVG